MRARTRSNRWLVLPLVCGLLGPLSGAGAQTPTPAGRRQLVGVVRDAGGAAIEGVNVVVAGATVRTNVRGAFELFTGEIDTVTISLRHVGFEPVDAMLSTRNRMWDTVLVQMEQTAQKLTNVKVTEVLNRRATGIRDFEARRSLGMGTYITRADIVERGSSRLSDLLRTKRGVNVVRGRVRFVANTAGSRNSACQPYIWLDGALARGMEVDELPSNTVEAIELYPYFSTVPAEFQSVGNNTTPCGTIVIWTRIPNGKAK